MIDFMNNFIRLENSNLLVLVDVNYGGKIVKLINKIMEVIGYGLMIPNIQNILQLNSRIMIHNGLEVMKNYILMIRLNLLLVNRHLIMESFGHHPGK